jgi:hypothetical protein
MEWNDWQQKQPLKKQAASIYPSEFRISGSKVILCVWFLRCAFDVYAS